MGGIESNPGPTNQETLIWLKNLTNMKFCESDLKAAKTFFGGFDGDRKQFSAWRDKFMNAHKKVKQETHMRLMRDCGGGGKKFDVPPTDFIPYSLIVNGGCARCDERFSDESNLIEHIKIAHGGEIKKAYSKEAMENVFRDQKYNEWLNRSTSVGNENDKLTISKMQEANQILSERLNSQSENAFTMVRENNGVSEMQKKVYTTTVDGKVKTSVITQQFIDVTSRKRRSNEQSMNSDPKRSCNAEKVQSKKVGKVLQHLAGDNIESQAGLVAMFLDGQGPEFAEPVSTQSKLLKEQNKFSPEETAAIASSTNMPSCTMDQIRTAHNNRF